MNAQDTVFNKKYTIRIGTQLMDFSTPKIMGILNVTPDSFFDGGKYNQEGQAITRVENMINDGMDILDIGAVSTRPKANNISFQEEKERILPFLKSIAKQFPQLTISVDTYRSEIAKMAISEGAHIINDISGGTMDENMFRTIGYLKVPYILMHIQGTPQNMQDNPQYENVTADVIKDLAFKMQTLVDLGVDDIIADPGFGFGKTVEQNFELLKCLADFEILEIPLLVGISRKSMINRTLGIKPENALNGTTALNAWALEKGANILRVHDVKEAKQVVTLHQEMNRI